MRYEGFDFFHQNIQILFNIDPVNELMVINITAKNPFKKNPLI